MKFIRYTITMIVGPVAARIQLDQLERSTSDQMKVPAGISSAVSR